MAIRYGTNYADYQYGTAYSDTFYGNAGNDVQYGYDGNDYMYGNDGNDSLYGMNGTDYLTGGAGHDYLSGGNNNDYLSGNDGFDVLFGGQGADNLSGGVEPWFLFAQDTFRIDRGDSPSYTGYSDTITDWNSRDKIDTNLTGNSSNYAEVFTTANNISTARAIVEGNSALRAEDHVFLYNPAINKGFLVSDLDRNNIFETGVVINGAGSAAAMDWSSLI